MMNLERVMKHEIWFNITNSTIEQNLKVKIASWITPFLCALWTLLPFECTTRNGKCSLVFSHWKNRTAFYKVPWGLWKRFSGRKSFSKTSMEFIRLLYCSLLADLDTADATKTSTWMDMDPLFFWKDKRWGCRHPQHSSLAYYWNTHTHSRKRFKFQTATISNSFCPDDSYCSTYGSYLNLITTGEVVRQSKACVCALFRSIIYVRQKKVEQSPGRN
jgi:hypothetical protein